MFVRRWVSVILKRGVTGFWNKESEEIVVNTEARVANFKSWCYTNVLQLGGKLIEWYEPTSFISYAHARVKLSGEELYILHHDVYDYIAFAKNIEMTNLHFINHKELNVLFNEQFQVLSRETLEERLLKGKSNKKSGFLLNENDLAIVELEQISYFSSETVGQVIFNYWD